MMERKFYNDEFEELIRQKTDQYKMYPSDKVWKGIYNSLHTKRRRFIAGMSVLIIGFLMIAGKELLMPAKHVASAKKAVVETLPKTNPVDATETFQAFKKENLIQTSSPLTDDKQNINQFITVDMLPDQQENKIPAPSADYISLPMDAITSESPKHVIGNNSLEKLPLEINSAISEPLNKFSTISVTYLRKEGTANYNESAKSKLTGCRNML